MNLAGRVGRLEVRRSGVRGSATCASCGFPLPASVRPAEVRFAVRPPRLIGEPDADDTSKDVCGACGRPLVYRLLSPRNLADAGPPDNPAP